MHLSLYTLLLSPQYFGLPTQYFEKSAPVDKDVARKMFGVLDYGWWVGFALKLVCFSTFTFYYSSSFYSWVELVNPINTTMILDHDYGDRPTN